MQKRKQKDDVYTENEFLKYLNELQKFKTETKKIGIGVNLPFKNNSIFSGINIYIEISRE